MRLSVTTSEYDKFGHLLRQVITDYDTDGPNGGDEIPDWLLPKDPSAESNLTPLTLTSPAPGTFVTINGGMSQTVPQMTVCPCDPSRGGSGICGCVMNSSRIT